AGARRGGAPARGVRGGAAPHARVGDGAGGRGPGERGGSGRAGAVGRTLPCGAMSHAHPTPPEQAPRRPRKQEQESAEREVREVAPNVLRMQLPIAMPGLGHVNMYALVDERGAAVVDPGLPTPASWKAVKDRLRQAGLRP